MVWGRRSSRKDTHLKKTPSTPLSCAGSWRKQCADCFHHNAKWKFADCFNPKQNLLSTRPRATRTQARVQCMEAGKEERQNGHEGKKRQAPAAPARARKQIPGAHVKTQNRLVAHKVQVQQFLPGARQSTAPSQKTQGEAARSDRAATATAPQTPEALARGQRAASDVGLWRWLLASARVLRSDNHQQLLQKLVVRLLLAACAALPLASRRTHSGTPCFRRAQHKGRGRTE